MLVVLALHLESGSQLTPPKSVYVCQQHLLLAWYSTSRSSTSVISAHTPPSLQSMHSCSYTSAHPTHGKALQT